jgi:hypothetical protein
MAEAVKCDEKNPTSTFLGTPFILDSPHLDAGIW